MRRHGFAPLLLAGAMLSPAAPAAAQFFESFDGATEDGLATIFTHDGSGFLPGGAAPISADVPSTNAFTGAGGGAAGSLLTDVGFLLDAGAGGAGDDVAAIQFVDDGSNGFTFGGIEIVTGALSSPGEIGSASAFIDVLAPAGAALQFRVESPFTSQNNGFFLDFVGTGEFETIGGVIGTDFTPTGDFNANDPTITLVVATSIGGAAPVGATTQILLNNASFTEIPEPTTLGLFGVASAALFGVRRRG